MYADEITPAMRQAIDETERRRAKQIAYNQAHGITPETIHKAVYDAIEATIAEEGPGYDIEIFEGMSREERQHLAEEMEIEMQKAAAALQFERAAQLRDMIKELTLPPPKGRKKSAPR